MKLTHSCIITENIKALTDFYEKVLQIQPETYGDDYVEFPTDDMRQNPQPLSR